MLISKKEAENMEINKIIAFCSAVLVVAGTYAEDAINLHRKLNITRLTDYGETLSGACFCKLVLLKFNKSSKICELD